MSTLPGQLPEEPETPKTSETIEFPSSEQFPPEARAENLEHTSEPVSDPSALSAPNSRIANVDVVQSRLDAIEPQLFGSYIQSFDQPRFVRPVRIPHLGHFGIFLLVLCFGWLGAGSLLLLGLHFHLFGISTLKDAIADFHYTLGSQAIQYFISLAACLVVFPAIWHKGFLEGIHWRLATALKLRGRLISVAVFCFLAAMLNGLLMPGPTDAPIDKIFRAPGAAWVLFIFGVTIAPFFEELAFRGFLLPALCTSYDWIVEKITGAPEHPVDENDHPQWSMPAMSVASLLTSLPFALMHGEQTSYSLGPFLLLVFISLVLCAIRLNTRSLAASTMVHAGYNFLLFSFMLLGTGGFKHLDKM